MIATPVVAAVPEVFPVPVVPMPQSIWLPLHQARKHQGVLRVIQMLWSAC